MDLAAGAPIHMTFADLESLLIPLIQQRLQECSNSSSPGQGGSASEAGQPDLSPILSDLHKLIAAHADSMRDCGAPGIPLPEVDEQLAPLQQEVEAVLQRLAGHRKQAPAVMAAALQQQLSQMRPPDDIRSVADQAVAPCTVAREDQQLPEAQQLHQALRAVLNKLPALRARLEEMEARLGRNLAAADAAQARASQPPRTVERALRGCGAAAGGDTVFE